MAARDFVAWVERRGQQLRRRLALSPLAVLDPCELAQRMGVCVLSPNDILGLDPSDLHHLLVENRDGWSAGSIRLPNGRVLILLNPTHPETRKRATLMEELAHVHLDHKPSELILLDGGIAVRSFKKSQETEAYWVGAAALLPRAVLQDAATSGIGRAALARQRGVSQDLVSFREKMAGIRLAGQVKRLQPA